MKGQIVFGLWTLKGVAVSHKFLANPSERYIFETYVLKLRVINPSLACNVLSYALGG